MSEAKTSDSSRALKACGRGQAARPGRPSEVPSLTYSNAGAMAPTDFDLSAGLSRLD